MPTPESLEVMVRYADLSGDTFNGTDPREIEDRINGKPLQWARVRILLANQPIGHGYAEACDVRRGERDASVFQCALRRAQNHRRQRLALAE